MFLESTMCAQDPAYMGMIMATHAGWFLCAHAEGFLSLFIQK